MYTTTIALISSQWQIKQIMSTNTIMVANKYEEFYAQLYEGNNSILVNIALLHKR